MKSWNLIGWIKAVLITLLSIHYLFFPISTTVTAEPFDFILPFVIGIVMVPIGIRLSLIKIIIEKPHWNDNPFRLRRFLIIIQFMSIMAIAFGLASLISGAVFYAIVDSMALLMLGSGLGYYLGMLLTLRLNARKQIKN
jgi:hypothetical protein